MTGIDMLVTNLLKASGVDPERVREDIQTYARNLAQKIDSMDRTMGEIRETQAEILRAVGGGDRRGGELGQVGQFTNGEARS